MRISEFWAAVTDEFGEFYGHTLTHDLVLDDLGDLTSEQAIAMGMTVRVIWLALCRATDVPEDRWHGRGLKSPKG